MHRRRRNYFIDKNFQTEFILKFCGLVALGCIVFGVILYIYSRHTLTTSFENSRLVVKSTADYLLPGLLIGLMVVGFSTAIATSIVVLLMTHRIAGPMYRFEKHAQRIASGELCSDLKIRRKDQFQNLVTTFNKMTEKLKVGILKIIEVSQRLDSLIDKISDASAHEAPLPENIEEILSELKRDKEELQKALDYFKINC